MGTGVCTGVVIVGLSSASASESVVALVVWDTDETGNGNDTDTGTDTVPACISWDSEYCFCIRSGCI